MERRLTLLAVSVVLVVVGLLPLLAMLAESVFVDGRVTLGVYEALFADASQYLPFIEHSLTLASLTTLCSLGLGVSLGLLLGKTDLPFRRVLTVILSIPLLLPPYILAVCWFNLTTGNGLLMRVISAQFSEGLYAALFGFPGCLWVLVSALAPVVMILTQVCLHCVDPRVEEAGRLIGRWPAVLLRITLPMIRPGILFAGMLVFLLALGEVGVPMLLRYPVFPLVTLTQFSAFYDFGAATAAATPLLVVALLLVILERRYLRDKTYSLRPTTPGNRVLIIDLGLWRFPLLLLVALLATAGVLLPLFALVRSSLLPFAYGDALVRAGDSLGRSLVFAGIGATLLAILGFFTGYLIQNRALRFWRALDSLTLLLFTLPGTVLGVGLIVLWNRPATTWIYGSPVILMFAYIAQYVAITSRITLATLANVPGSLEEAAQIAGARWHARIWHVVIPAVLPGVIAAWLVGFVFCLRDLGASMLVYPSGQDTLPVRIFTLMANGAPNLIAAMCVVLATVALTAMLAAGCLLRWLIRQR